MVRRRLALDLFVYLTYYIFILYFVFLFLIYFFYFDFKESLELSLECPKVEGFLIKLVFHFCSKLCFSIT